MFPLFLTIFFFSVNAQNPERRGYVGVGLGPSFLMGYSEGSISAGTGLNLNLLNFGYIFGKGLGVNATWVGGAHIIKNNTNMAGNNIIFINRTEISYGMLMVGPMYSLNISERSTIDFKARAGIYYVRETFSFSSNSSLNSDSYAQTRNPGYSLASTYRYQFASRWCGILSGDYFSSLYNSSFFFENKVRPLSLTAGVGFVF